MDDCPSVQTHTLINVDSLEKFNDWIYEKVKEYIGKRILEVGSGWGSFTKYFVQEEFVVGVDINEEYIKRLKSSFGKCGNCEFLEMDITKATAKEMKKFHIDTVIAMNLIEHLENDFEILKLFYDILIQKGKVILTVPAFNFLYGTLDRYLNHKRRYSSRELKSICRRAGFQVKKVFYLNFFSMFGWFISS